MKTKNILLTLLLSSGITYGQQKFIHPGILHTTTDFKKMIAVVKEKKGVAYESFLLLKNDPKASADYQMNGPFRVISRDGEFAFTKSKMEQDFSAAYLNAIMWIVSRERSHALKTMQILTAYADTLKEIPPTNDAPLLVGLEGFKIFYAAEVIKYTYKQFDPKDMAKISNMMKSVFIPVMDKFYATPAYTNGNWGGIVGKTYLAAAIFFDDHTMYKKAVDFYLNGNDNGTIQHYIDPATGQIQESGRDQGHCQLGIGAMATLCEEAYKQGDDLYQALDNRLLKGFEYVARYNLGDDNVPFRQWKDVTGRYNDWTKISTIGRGKFIPIYQMVYHHYFLRKKIEMPYVKQVVEKNTPEGFDRDQPAFGTFLFSGEQ